MAGAVEFYNENELRSYPFRVDSTLSDILAAIVDARFVLSDGYGFTPSTSFLELKEVLSVGDQYELVWSVVNGSGPDLSIFVPHSAGRYQSFHGVSGDGKSHGHIVIGHVSKIAVGTYNARLERRCVLALSKVDDLQVHVLNAQRRESLRPYFEVDPNNTPTQDYEEALAKAPPYDPDVVGSGPVSVSLPASDPVLVFTAGYNMVVTARPSNNEVQFRFRVGEGLGQDCTPLDVSLSKSETLRTINNLRPVGGNLKLPVGQGLAINTDQSDYRVTFEAKRFQVELECPVTRQEEQDPPPISDPPPAPVIPEPFGGS